MRPTGVQMGKVFISYASEDRALASDINARLQQSGHDVFFDESNLKPSDAYDNVIQHELARSDIMLFLCSKHSLSPGRYTLTELEMAKSVWKKPQGRVLPVLLGDTDFGDLPSYLKGLSAYRQKGDPVSEITQMANELVSRRRRKKQLVWGGGIAAALILAVLAYVAGTRVATDEVQPPEGTIASGLPPEAAPPPAPAKPEMDRSLHTLSITSSMLQNPRSFDQVKFEVPENPAFCPEQEFNILNKSDQTVMVTLGFAQSGSSIELGPVEPGGFIKTEAPSDADLGIVLMDMDTKNFFYFAEVSVVYCYD